MMHKQFVCPKCGGRTWGTSMDIRHCNGTMLDFKSEPGKLLPVPCRFTWPIADDWKYEVLMIGKEGPNDQSQAIAQAAVLDYLRTGPADDFKKPEETT